jgi:hypothetical protein
MRHLLLTCVIALGLSSCRGPETKAPETLPVQPATVQVTDTAAAFSFPYEATLVNDWRIGDPKNVVKVMEMYRILEKGEKVDSLILPYLADTIVSVSYDDRVYKGPPMPYLKTIVDFRKRFSSLREEFISYVPLHSPSKNLDMVAIWIEERVTLKNGRLDSTLYSENWFFDKDGKAFRRASFSRYEP